MTPRPQARTWPAQSLQWARQGRQHHVGPHMSAPSSAHCLSEMWEARESMMSSSSCWLSERSVGSLETCGGNQRPKGWSRVLARARWPRSLLGT